LHRFYLRQDLSRELSNRRRALVGAVVTAGPVDFDRDYALRTQVRGQPAVVEGRPHIYMDDEKRDEVERSSCRLADDWERGPSFRFGAQELGETSDSDVLEG
jgi:hypothetical protein